MGGHFPCRSAQSGHGPPPRTVHSRFETMDPRRAVWLSAQTAVRKQQPTPGHNLSRSTKGGSHAEGVSDGSRGRSSIAHPPRRVGRHRAVHGDDRGPQPTALRRGDGEALPLRRIIVQGGVTSGLLNAVVAEDLPGPGSVFLHVTWDFKAPVAPGDLITAEVEVLSVREDKPIYEVATKITNQDDVLVLDGTAVVWRDPEVAAAG